MVRIKVSDVMLIMLLVLLVGCALYGTYSVMYNGTAFKGIRFIDIIIQILCGGSMIISCVAMLMLAAAGIQSLSELEFTINTNKLKQILNKLK